MTADELLKAAIQYGADEAGIMDRFHGNVELYELCFRELLDTPYTDALAAAVRRRDYNEAFEAAHALKGLSANLGLIPYYETICALVESLRAQRYTNIGEECAEAVRQFDIVRRVYSGEHITQAAAAPERPDKAYAPSAPKKERQKKREWFILIATGVAVLGILVVLLLFRNITVGYQKNVTTDSAGHLQEINYQLKEYVANQIESDWLTAFTVKSYIVRTGLVDSDREIVSIMRELSELWGASDVILYTGDGYSISGNGETKANDLASDMISEAHARGQYMTIMDSDLIYTIPVEGSIPFRNSTVSAISVVKDMRTFLDEMGFSSFDSSAYIYLCDSNGAVISRTHSDAAKTTFNVISLFKDTAVTTISGATVTAQEMMSVTQPTAYMHGDDYVVFSPVQTRQGIFWLAYFVPEVAVNKTMDGFSDNVTRSSILMISVFLALALFTVAYINSIRKKQLDKALLAREHMFDLLVNDSQTAFALFNVNSESPTYISSNSFALTGDDKPFLCKTESGFEMKSGLAPDSPAFAKVNQTLGEWDGKGVYRSGFVRNENAEPPNYYELQLTPVAENSDEYIGVAQDVTLLYDREATIRNSLAMAEQASDAKSRFLSNMSHDIRTPMNAIVNMADFAIEDMDDPDKLREHLKTIRASSDHLLGLINDILDMSRIESGKATIDSSPFDLRAELNRLQSIISPLCAEKGLTLITDFEGVGPSQVLGDQVKVSQILMNLLSNAVKFTPKNGAVRFSAREAPSIRENYVDIRFVVEDTGIGVSPEFIPHLFEPFSREDVKRISGIEGTGLGLSICHSYVIAMGGQIKCDSIEGDGTTFTVDLFFEKTDAMAPAQIETTAWDVTPFIGMRCLFIEDNPTNQRIGKTVLERLGFRVDLAGDGREGLATFKHSSKGYYDIVYMDIQMPDMDGYEAAAAIRESGHPRARTIPIIAVSANVFIEDIEKAHIAGMNGHVGKPISTTALANETKRVLNSIRR